MGLLSSSSKKYKGNKINLSFGSGNKFEEGINKYKTSKLDELLSEY